jgi:glycerophosphoryl diester phosphodiesterase
MPGMRHLRGRPRSRRPSDDILIPGMPELARLRRVGHKGADLIAPGNTFKSFDAALEAGVDMIEFDVLISRDGSELVLAHDYRDAASRTPHTLEEGLAYLNKDAFAGVEIDVDLKLPGYELRVLEALRSFGMHDRALISSQYRASLAILREAAPEARLGWSVPRLRRDPFRSRALLLPALLAVWLARMLLPLRAGAAIRRRDCDALMAHWRLVTPWLVRSVRRAGGELYVWTVDDIPRLRSLEKLGVTGVITNDPRLFAALA